MNLYILVLFVVTLFNTCKSNITDEPLNYSIIKRHILSQRVKETSGIIKYKNLIWTFNDSGGRPEIYGINLANDSIEQVIYLKNAFNRDWEDIAQDNEYIYVGDIGNNQGNRDSLVVYKISKSAVPSKGNVSVKAEKIVYKYPDYVPVNITVSWSAFDCEALFVIKDSLYVMTKDWKKGTSTIYSLPKQPGKYMARKIKALNPHGLITGADFQDSKLIVIGYRNFVPFIIRFNVSDINQITDDQGYNIELTNLATYQTEGICFDGNKILISSEQTRSPAQILEIRINK